MTPLTEFFDAFGIQRPQAPTARDRHTTALCLRLIDEEFKEVTKELRELMLLEELGASTAERLETLGCLLKELADLRYVAEYAAVAHGLPIDAAYADVHRANMSKLDDDGNPIFVNGKVQKGPNYKAPDMAQFIHVMEEEDA